MRYLQINDPHISDQPPRMRTASYREDVLAKLAACVDIAIAEQVDRIVITGDVFHRKRARDTSHRTVQQVRAILHGGPPVSIVPGNHDEAHGGGLGGQPLLSLLDEHITLLDGTISMGVQHAGLTIESWEDLEDWLEPNIIAGVPWSNAFEREGGLEAFAAAARATGAMLIFTHSPISDRPFPFGPEAQGWMLRDDVAAALEGSGVRIIAHGHFHQPQQIAIYQRPDMGTPFIVFSNPGALARATIAEDDRERAPQVAIIDSERLEGRYVEVPHRAASEVFRLAEHEASVTRREGVSALSAALSSAYSEIVDAEYLTAAVREQPRPQDVDEGDWARGQDLAIAAIDGVE